MTEDEPTKVDYTPQYKFTVRTVDSAGRATTYAGKTTSSKETLAVISSSPGTSGTYLLFETEDDVVVTVPIRLITETKVWEVTK